MIRAKEIAEEIKKKLSIKDVKTAVILGSGLSGFTQKLEHQQSLSYKEIKGFPQTGVSGHKGELIYGYIGAKEVLCLNGRFHLYEGHEPQTIAQVIRVLKDLGIKRLIITNAAGSLRKDMAPGTLMLIKDHINYSGKNPLVGANDETYGSRFPAMNNAYPEYFREKCKKIAKNLNISVKEGTYFMVLGPNFETAAEVRAFGILGGDAVGMSTVPEVIAAVHCGIEVLGISVITNYAAGLVNNTPTHQETLEEADKASLRMSALVTEFIKEEE